MLYNFCFYLLLHISFVSSACEFRLFERTGAHDKENSDFIIIIIILFQCGTS